MHCDLLLLRIKTRMQTLDEWFVCVTVAVAVVLSVFCEMQRKVLRNGRWAGGKKMPRIFVEKIRKKKKI